MSKKVKDGSLKYYWAKNGRKYRGMILVFIFLLLGLLVASQIPVAGALYTEFVAGILASYTVYCGGNVARAFITGRFGGPVDGEPTLAPSEEPDVVHSE